MGMNTFKGIIDQFSSKAEYIRIRVPDDKPFYLWRDGNRGSLAPDQEALHRFLDAFRLYQDTFYPLVSFQVSSVSQSRLAWNVRWLSQDQEVTALYHSDECTVLGEEPSRPTMLLKPEGFEAQIFQGRLHYLAKEPDSSDTCHILVPTGNLIHLEELPKYDDLQAVLIKNRYDAEVAQALSELSFCLLRESGWRTFEKDFLKRLCVELAEFIREMVLVFLDEDELHDAWHHSPNQPLLQRLVPKKAQLWSKQDDALDQIATLLAKERSGAQQFIQDVKVAFPDVTVSAVTQELCNLPPEMRVSPAVIVAFGGSPPPSQMKDLLQERGWSSIEQIVLDQLDATVAESTREDILLSLNQDELRDAWEHSSNQSALRRLMPEQTQLWLRDQIATLLAKSQDETHQFIQAISDTCPDATLDAIAQELGRLPPEGRTLLEVIIALGGPPPLTQMKKCLREDGWRKFERTILGRVNPALTKSVRDQVLRSLEPDELRDAWHYPMNYVALQRLVPDQVQYLLQEGWSYFEQTILGHLDSATAESVRDQVLLSLDRDDQRAAWEHLSNRAALKRLAPDKTRKWVQEETLEQILDDLKFVSLNLQVRDGRIQGISICDKQGKMRHWRKGFERAIRSLSKDPSMELLVGYKLTWDLQYLERVLPEVPLLRLPIVDTRVLNAILKPRGWETLQLEEDYRGAEGVCNVIELFRQQIVDLAQFPNDQLERWMELAGPGLQRVLVQVIRYQKNLAYSSESSKEERRLPSKNPLKEKQWSVERLDDLLKALPDDKKVLFLVPRSLLPLFAGVDRANILDLRGLYLEEPRRGRTARLRNSEKSLKVPSGDLLICIDAFIQESRARHQSTHEACIVDWIRTILNANPEYLSAIGNSYDEVRERLSQVPTLRAVVPLDALQNTEFMEYLQAQQFNYVLLAGTNVAIGELKASIPSQEVPQLRPQMLPYGGGRVIGLSEQDMEQWWKAIPSDWRSWLIDTLEDGWEMHVIPKDLEEYLKKKIVSPDKHITMLKLGDTSEWIHICCPKEQFRERNWLTPASPYRAEYLGQLIGFVAPLARQKRVLLILRNQKDASRLNRVLEGKDLYVPSGNLTAQMAYLAREGRGLVISQADELIGCVLQSRARGLQKPVDMVIAEAWPVDDPLMVPPPTCEDLKKLRRKQGEESDEYHITSDEAEYDQKENDRVFSARDSALFWTDILTERLKENADVLKSFVWAAERLSEVPLLVLDARLPAEKVGDIGRFTVKPSTMDFDEEMALQVSKGLDTRVGSELSKRYKGKGESMPRREEWSNLAHHLFNLPGDLYNWQKDYLDNIMFDRYQTLTVEAPTGGGKSLLYQFPALVRGAQTGLLTLVISPLRALMHEQCRKLWQIGFVFTVEAISGDLSPDQVDEVYKRLADGQIQLLFVAPERFRSRRFRQALKERLRRDRKLQYWVFDEAHCISLWGHDFRPDYFYAAQEAQRLRTMMSEEIAPVILLSATLPDRTIRDLEEIFEHGD